MNYKKQKRIPLSIIRLYKLASRFSLTEKKYTKTTQEIMDFLTYINKHKNDSL